MDQLDFVETRMYLNRCLKLSTDFSAFPKNDLQTR